jgi:anti-anti-sigma factor
LRYLNDAAGLARHLPPQLATIAAQPRKPVNSALQAYDLDSALVVVISGDINSSLLSQFDLLMRRIGEQERHVVLDMSRVAYLGPDTLGSLVHRMQRSKRQGQQFWLADLPAHVRRVLRTAHLEHCFAITPTVADAIYRLEKAERLLPMELMAARSMSREARSSVNVQVEFLQDLCKRIGSVEETAELNFAGFTTRTSTGR